MKEINKLFQKLTTIKKRWEDESSNNEKKIAAAKSKLNIAMEAREAAEDPTEYGHATKAIETAENEIGFYTMQASKFNHRFGDKEFGEMSEILKLEKQALIKAKKAELSEDFSRMIAKIEQFESDMREIKRTEDLLNEMSGKPIAAASKYYATDLATPAYTRAPEDSFSRFFDFYVSEKNKLEVLNIKR